ncbi:hypothetical protein KEM56_007831 [Ascosphaera pollenicola]|nr:hypothetical protein KEM56_007831 [Ascosphaera pollenicola]
MHPPDPVSSALLPIYENPQSPSGSMRPTHRRCCSECAHDQLLHIQHSTSEIFHCPHIFGSSSANSSQPETPLEDQAQEHFHRQQQQRKLTNDILEHPLIRSTSVHKVSQDTNATHESMDYDPRHQSQQAVICNADSPSPSSIYSPHFMAPGAFGVGGETPEMDRQRGFDYPYRGIPAKKKEHMEYHVRFDIDSSEAEEPSIAPEEDGASIISEILEPQKFDPSASMEIPIALDCDDKGQTTEKPAQKQQNSNTPEHREDRLLGQRRGLLPSALPDAFQAFSEQSGTSYVGEFTRGPPTPPNRGPPTPPKDVPPRNLGQTPSPPDSRQSHERTGSSYAAAKISRKHEEWSVFPPRRQNLTPDQKREVNGQTGSAQQSQRNDSPAVHMRSQPSGSQQAGNNEHLHARANSNQSSMIAFPRQVLDANGNPAHPHSRQTSTDDSAAKPRAPFESPRPPPQPPVRTNARNATPQTPAHSHTRSNSSGIQHDPQTPAQSYTTWRPQFNFSVFDNSMSPSTPGNDLRVQIQQMQRQLKIQQMQLERIQAAGVDVPMVSPKTTANQQYEQMMRQHKSYTDLRYVQGQGQGPDGALPSDQSESEPRRESRSGSMSRLRSLSPSKVRNRRKQSPPKIQHLGPAPLNIVHERRSPDAELYIDSNLANNGKSSPVKTGKSDVPRSASEVSPSHIVIDRLTPETSGSSIYISNNTQRNALFRSVSTPQNRRGCLDDVAEDKVVNSVRRDSEKEGNQTKTPKGSSLKEWGSKIMKSMQDLTDHRKPSVTSAPINPFQSRLSPYGPNRAPVSLDPPTQARLYADLDLLICIAANQFIIQQHKARRISVDSFSKLLNNWMNKTRPVVPQFMFDQLTQRDLISAHSREFKFYGEAGRSAPALNNMLDIWKTLAEEMGLRTYFHPDSTVRRHFNEALRVLEMLGASPQTLLSFQEIQSGALGVIKKVQEREKRVDDAPAGFSSDFIALEDDSDR